jgi:hypothetical protein
MWFIIIVAIILIALKMNNNYKHNQKVENVINSINAYGFSESSEIVEWEAFLRQQLAMVEVLFRGGEITEQEYVDRLKALMIKHREIEEKYNITEEEMSQIYRDRMEIADDYDN